PSMFILHDVLLNHALAYQKVLLLDLALVLLDLLGHHPGLDGLLVAILVVGPEAVEDAVDAVAGEQADEVVLGGQEEARLAGVALAAGAPAKLVVDAPRLVALGAADEQPAGLHHDLAVARDALLHARQDVAEALLEVRVAGLQAELAQLELGQVLGVAAELDVDAAARHVGRDGHRAGLAGLGHDLALALRVLGLGVEHGVLDAAPVQLRGQQFGDLDRDGADEDRLLALVARRDLAPDCDPLAVLGLVDLIVAVVADHRP